MRKGPAGTVAAVVLILLTLLNTYFILKAKDENAQRITETHTNCRNVSTLARKAHVSIRNCKGERVSAAPAKRRASKAPAHDSTPSAARVPLGTSSAPPRRSPIARANPLRRITTRTGAVPTSSGPSPVSTPPFTAQPAAPPASRPAPAPPETEGPFGLPCLMPGGVDVLC